MKKLIMHPVFAGPLIIVGLALLIVYALIPPPPCDWSWAYVRNELWQMRGGVGALLGAGLGLGAVAVAASSGFHNLIAAQKHQAKVDHDAELDRIEWERRCLAAGLAGELRAVRIHSEAHVDYLRGSATLAANLAASTGSKPHEYFVEVAPMTECAFYAAIVGKLGILGTDLSGHVTMTYEMLAMWRRDAEKAPKYPPATQVKFLPEAADNIEGYIPLITEVIDRLEAIEQGLPDPGEGPAAAAGEAGD